ncbi:Transmembrane protein 53 [Linum grandiflorum]
MGSLSGILHRPIVAAAAVAVASISTDISDRFPSLRYSANSHSTEESVPDSDFLWSSHIAVSKLADFSFVNRIPVPLPNVNSFHRSSTLFSPANAASMVAASPRLAELYQSAQLAKGPKTMTKTKTETTLSSSTPDVLYRWHLPQPNAVNVSGSSDCCSEKSRTVVVLLGWLGSKQKHLKKYAEWYTSMGFHAITFTFPMSEILSYQVGGKAEQDVELLVNHLAGWLDEEEIGKNLVFHTFSNTGWLTYGVMLEKFQEHDPALVKRIRACVVDSAPVATPDPQVWASGFCAAFLKKNSVATKGHVISDVEVLVGSSSKSFDHQPKPALTETALQMVLEKFFGVVLNLPAVNKRLSDVLSVLSTQQPKCPQLYIYSSADRVIPSGSVESFIDEQKKAGHEVRACNFVSTPHVDHFRNDPKLYTSQLTDFIDDCVLTCCKHS